MPRRYLWYLMPYKESEKKRERDRKYREAHREQILERKRKWRKAHPEQAREHSKKYREFRTPEMRKKQHEQQAKWREENREKKREQDRVYSKAHSEKKRKWRKEDRKAHPEKYRNSARQHRALKAKNPMDQTAKDYAIILEGDPCSYCNSRCEHVDHIVPLSAGGDSSSENLTAACGSCNCSKGAKPLLLWLSEHPVQF